MKNDPLDNYLVYMYEVERQAKGHFFSKDAMLFFKSRLPQDAYKRGESAYYFITSECGPDGIRAFTIRVMGIDRDIRTVGEFQGYATKALAKGALRRIFAEQVELGFL